MTKEKFNKAGEKSTPVSLPHTRNAFDGQDAGDDYHRGTCSYKIPLPDPTEGKRQYIEFRGASHVATVWCNGVLLGELRGVKRK